jgi:hypothetical protein
MSCTEMHALPCAIQKPDVDFAEVVLREFSRETLEPNERTDRGRTQGADEIVERRLPAGIPGELRAPQDLDREELGLPRQQLDDQAPKGLGLRGSTNVSLLALLRVIDLRHIRLTRGATDASEGHAGERSHLDLGVARSPQNLNLVPFEHVDHPKISGAAATAVRFSAPGTYVIRAVADDGIFTTPADVTVVVKDVASAAQR